MKVNALKELKATLALGRLMEVTDIRILWRTKDGEFGGQVRRIEDIHLLDFEYDSGFGTQHLFGVVWLSDGTWFERLEYDGSECWVRVKRPVVEEVKAHHEYMRKLWS